MQKTNDLCGLQHRQELPAASVSLCGISGSQKTLWNLQAVPQLLLVAQISVLPRLMVPADLPVCFLECPVEQTVPTLQMIPFMVRLSVLQRFLALTIGVSSIIGVSSNQIGLKHFEDAIWTAMKKEYFKCLMCRKHA